MNGFPKCVFVGQESGIISLGQTSSWPQLRVVLRNMKRATRTPLGSKLYAGHPRKTTLRRALVCIASHWGVGDAFPRRVVFQESLFLKNFRLPSAAYKGRPR